MNPHESAAHRVSPPLLVTVREAAELLGIGRTKLYELLLAGEIVTVTIGRARRVPLASLHAYVRSLEDSPVTATQVADTLPTGRHV